MILRLLMGCVLVGSWGLNVQAESVSFKPHVTIKTPEIYLGDVFQGLPPAQGGIPVQQAPAPGKKVVWYTPTLRKMIKQFHLEAVKGMHDHAQVTIERLGYPVSQGILDGLLAEKLKEYVADKKFKIYISSLPPFLPFPLESDSTVSIHAFSFHSQKHTFQAAFTFQKHPDVMLPVKGKICFLKKVPTLKNPVTKGALITEKDVDFTFVEDSPYLRDAVLRAQDLFGSKAVHQGLEPGQVILVKDVAFADSIRKGHRVELIYQKKNMVLSASGIAEEDGRNGDLIRVRNSRTKEIVTGTVQDGCVIVSAKK